MDNKELAAEVGRFGVADRATQAAPQAPSGLGHSVSIPSAEDLIDCADFTFLAALEHLPRGWWWSGGVCSVSCHASIGPDSAYHDKATLIAFDDGFHADLPQPSTLDGALWECINQAASAIEARRAETAQQGSVEDESAVLEEQTPNPESDHAR